jgi:hypothetical protein
MNEFDDLDELALTPWERGALICALAMIILFVVGCISFTTGYAWGYLQAGILAVLG